MTKAEPANEPSQTPEALVAQVAGLLDGERNLIANAANAAAAVYFGLGAVNWAGFYFLHGASLVLGPFCGKPAVTRIAVPDGVCGSAVARRETLVVDDVLAFAGHIACDPASSSEIVVPLRAGDTIVGVLDVDSPRAGRFGAAERDALEAIAAMLVRGSDIELPQEVLA